MTDVAVSSFENLRQKIEHNLSKPGANKQKLGRTKPTTITTEDSERGKKRSRDGRVLEKQSGSRDGKSQSKAVPREHVFDNDEFKQVVAELGGGQEDFDLMQDAQSDSEVEGNSASTKDGTQAGPRKGKTLESGMANILKEIALARSTYGEDGTDDEAGVKDRKSDKTPQQLPEITQTSAAVLAVPVSNKKQKTRFLCDPRPDWYSLGRDVEFDTEMTQTKLSPKSLEQLQKHALDLLRRENDTFQAMQSSSSSQAFYSTVIASGTLSDKVSALTLAVQESPLHNMKALEGLLGLAKKRSRTQAVDVLRALKDLFAQGSLLPGDRRLYHFSSQPGLIATFGQLTTWDNTKALPHDVQDKHLVVWAFEDWLKFQYFDMLKILETWCGDELEFAKTRATSYVYELLKEKPEQEANLLRLLINKLGDPVKKIASQASYLIMQLLATHPAMKEIVVSTIDSDFIFKPGQTMHAKYYAAVTLNQTALSAKEEAIAVKLLDIYFGLFRTVLKPEQELKTAQPVKSVDRHERQKKKQAKAPSTDQDEELKEKLISAVLTGVNRAYPYCGVEHQSFNENMDTLFQITHAANFNTSIQAMMLIQQLVTTNSIVMDRFYRTLYESLLDTRLITSSKQQLYLNLLHKSLKADLNTKRVKAFAKRILQILTLQEPSFICGAFFLLRDLEKTIPSLVTMLDHSEEDEDQEESFHDVDEDAPSIVPVSDGVEVTRAGYDAYKRAPEFAKADGSCLWEVLPYLVHYHPAVDVSADHLMDHKNIPGKPDLSLHTLIHFLDRFVYKNPKLVSTKLKGTSIMQPMASEDTRAVLLSTNTNARMIPVNSEEFRVKKENDVAAEDAFFHQYFQTVSKPTVSKSKKASKSIDDHSDPGSEDEDEIWKAMVDTAPDLEGLVDDEDEDEDEMSDMSGLESEMSEDDLQAHHDGGSDDGVDVEAGIFDDSDEELPVTASPGGDDEVDFDSFASDDDVLELEDEATSANTQRNKEKREQRKKFKALPTFASAADYAKMLDNDEDEDLG